MYPGETGDAGRSCIASFLRSCSLLTCSESGDSAWLGKAAGYV